MKKIIFALLLSGESYALEITPQMLGDNFVSLTEKREVIRPEEVSVGKKSCLCDSWRFFSKTVLVGLTLFFIRELYIRYQSYSTDDFS
ncbi:MAG: hypothetical protein K6C34_05010 [Alphaproteobacteria bacterium]|nr:hypothetical protein [Alphaproteobacteria bacterium]